MSIANAIQKGRYVYAYDERGKQILTIFAGDTSKGDGLLGYTSTTVNIKQGNRIYTYDEKGKQLSVRTV